MVAWPAWALEAWMKAQPYAERLAVWRGYEAELETLVIYSVGIAIYTALVFTFYQTISRRDVYATSRGTGWGGRFKKLLNVGLLFPAVSFLYFAVLAMSLFFLSKDQGVQQILLVSMAVVMSVRVTTYLSEGMSSDLSKIVPLGLLGVLIISPGYLDLATAWTRLTAAYYQADLLLRYFLLFIVIEGALRGVRATGLHIRAGWRARRSPKDEAPAAVAPGMAEPAGDPDLAFAPPPAAAAAAKEPTRLVVVKEGPAPAPAEKAPPVAPAPPSGDKR